MKKSFALVVLFLVSLATPMVGTSQSETTDSIEVLTTVVNPANNNTYHLLSAASWEDSASYALSLGGFLTTVDDEAENTWLFDTFASWDNQSRHLWTGLSDSNAEGNYRWHDGTPFLYRDWGDAQPSAGGDEDYVHIASTNMGNIMPGTWNDLENDPQYFPVYGVVELGPGADYSLRFNGDGDHVVVDHDSGMDVSNSTRLSLEAWIYPYDDEGLQFIMMKGDYGWGLYLNGDSLAYSSQYSLSQHPVSNQSIEVNEWTHVRVDIELDVGGEFFVNDESAGLIDSENAKIPIGDFGSNDCFTSGEDCDEFYIGRMGAGCDCNYFGGMMDNISISTGVNGSNDSAIQSEWTFPEGEGNQTADAVTSTRQGSIVGADWVMPDGSIVAQAVELFIGDEYVIDEANAGDTLLFFTEVEAYTRSLTWFSSTFKFDYYFDDLVNYEVYVGFGSIPNEWNNDGSFTSDFGWGYEEWSWPTEGVVWFVLIPDDELEDLAISLEAVVADPPPTLDDMTELKQSIAVTNQEISTSGNFDEIGMNYYYINVTEPLADLRVRTYGGRGDVDLGMSYYSPPEPDYWWGWEESFDIELMEDSDSTEVKETWSMEPGNDEEVHLFDVEPGLYYITAYTTRNARGFTIVADFVYPPENVDPADAITLTPGVEYGLLSGYDGLSQYFKVDVPQGTERLIVDLSDGEGEASLYMRLDQAPTSSTYDYHSTNEGAGDRIAFNDPTPGTWYILLNSESAFTGVNILADFAERYVWDYDGTPIQLYNDEPLEGISIPKGESIELYAVLEEPGNIFVIESFGGSGDIQIIIDGVQYELIFGGGGGRPGDFELETETDDVTIKSGKSGTNHMVTLDFPMNGIMEVEVIGVSNAEEVSLVAYWDESDFPIDPVDPVEPSQPTEATSCVDRAKEDFASSDTDDSGVLEPDEIGMGDGDMITSAGPRILMMFDLNDDGVIEYREHLQVMCSCDNEISTVYSELSPYGGKVSIEVLEKHEAQNEYDFESVDANEDGFINAEELEILMVLCETTFSPFDTDGDGVPDDDDAFPEDPDESVDTDGDGVGDNADLAPSVANDLIYSSAALVFIILAGLLFAFMRTNRDPSDVKDWGDEQRMDAAIFDMNQDEGTSFIDPAVESLESIPPLDLPAMTESLELPSSLDLPANPSADAPDATLMGMVLDGQETIEFPSGSGVLWIRDEPEHAWEQKL
ncbi:MAG: pre-peptidase C-terminal domain-containing protein [Candidatus Poseidonia sp.]|uniref:pre-peptidase C-terminal domain-containing protein n=1 Tax=Poseidonia sp. TaxID=2666344 RepID=UPI0030C09A7A|nr:pre-peptidase C-terminal domain-containing protein [Poseidonia sp.]